MDTVEELRDYFAGQALAGILSRPNTRIFGDEDRIANTAYELADEMLKRRERK